MSNDKHCRKNNVAENLRFFPLTGKLREIKRPLKKSSIDFFNE